MLVNQLEFLQPIAHELHGYFQNMFFSLITLFIVISVLIDTLRLPLGGAELNPAKIIGRSLIATLLLVSYPSIANFLSTLSSSIAEDLGGFHNINLIKEEMSKKLKDFTLSWLSLKESLLVVFSFFSFALLYFSIFIAESLLLFVWLLCYVLSPLLISFFVFEKCQGATLALFRSLVEASFWKIFWAISASLLWSSALVDIKNASNSDFIAIVGIIFFLSCSLVATPIIVHLLMGKGIAGAASMLQAMAIPGLSRNFRGATRGSKLAAKNFYQNRVSPKLKNFQLSNLKPNKVFSAATNNSPTQNPTRLKTDKTTTKP